MLVAGAAAGGAGGVRASSRALSTLSSAPEFAQVSVNRIIDKRVLWAFNLFLSLRIIQMAMTYAVTFEW